MKRKGPPNLPEIGDLCRMRGGQTEGVCAAVASGSLWTRVWWQGELPSRERPMLCHLYELEKREWLF
jgi:hypothetical protein